MVSLRGGLKEIMNVQQREEEEEEGTIRWRELPDGCLNGVDFLFQGTRQ